MSKDLNDVAPSLGEISTIHVALEVSGTSWVLGIGDPEQAHKVGMHKLAPADTAGLLERIGKARAGADGPSRVAADPRGWIRGVSGWSAGSASTRRRSTS